jgi:chloride channel 3/4/5
MVEDHGVLTGLVTVKDVLKFIALEKPDRHSSFENELERVGGLDGMLDEVWTRSSRVVGRVVGWSRSLIRR